MSEKVIMGLMGDVMIGRLVDEYTDHRPPEYIWGDLLSVIKSHDLNLINLETTLTFSEKVVPKVFNFKAQPRKVESLKAANVTVANLANNHILDYSEDGLLETIATLDKAGIFHMGAGNNSVAAHKPVILEKNGLKVGFIGCTDNEPEWEATEKQSGTFYVDVGDIDALKSEIEILRPQVDVLILSIHWGPNMRERPTQRFIKFAHDLIDLGVDILHGHSAHIFQGIEVYNKGLILYDTGDFVDDYAVDPFLRNDYTFLYQVEFTKDGVKSLKLIPAAISNCQVNRAEPDDWMFICQKMQERCKDFRTTLHLEEEDGKPYLLLLI